MERRFTFAEGEYYHVYNRGVEKRNIFNEDRDRERFLRLLFAANGDLPYKYEDIKNLPFLKIKRGEPLVAIGAFCLMPNHFHFLVKEIREKGLSKFMEKLTTGYSSYFNKKHDRVGPLFQGRFKAEHVDEDEYLKYLYSYIHLNPVKMFDAHWKEKGITDRVAAKKYLDNYRYSSYLEYTGVLREEGAILTSTEFPEYFLGSHEFEGFVDDWLAFKTEDGEESLQGSPSRS
jgi:putative transposase